MRVALHIGAHRTATTTLQGWCRENRDTYASAGVVLWEPAFLRAGILAKLGLHAGDPEDTDAARRDMSSRLAAHIGGMARQGARALIVSEENILGSMRNLILDAALYPDALERLERARAIFGPVDRIALGIRFLPSYWASVYGFLASLPQVLPKADFEAIAAHPRSWRDVIEEVRMVFPEADLVVWSFDKMAAQPRAQIAALLGQDPLPETAILTRPHLRNARSDLAALEARLAQPVNRTPFGTFDPFSPEARAALKARYSADLTWLAAENGNGLTYID